MLGEADAGRGGCWERRMLGEADAVVRRPSRGVRQFFRGRRAAAGAAVCCAVRARGLSTASLVAWVHGGRRCVLRSIPLEFLMRHALTSYEAMQRPGVSRSRMRISRSESCPSWQLAANLGRPSMTMFSTCATPYNTSEGSLPRGSLLYLQHSVP